MNFEKLEALFNEVLNDLDTALDIGICDTAWGKEAEELQAKRVEQIEGYRRRYEELRKLGS